VENARRVKIKDKIDLLKQKQEREKAEKLAREANAKDGKDSNKRLVFWRLWSLSFSSVIM
jgi:hypothetical protein